MNSYLGALAIYFLVHSVAFLLLACWEREDGEG